MPFVRGGPGQTWKEFSQAETDFADRIILGGNTWAGNQIDVSGYRTVIGFVRISSQAGPGPWSCSVFLNTYMLDGVLLLQTFTLIPAATAVPLAAMIFGVSSYQDLYGAVAPVAATIPPAAKEIAWQVSNNSAVGSDITTQVECVCVS